MQKFGFFFFSYHLSVLYAQADSCHVSVLYAQADKMSFKSIAITMGSEISIHRPENFGIKETL